MKLTQEQTEVIESKLTESFGDGSDELDLSRLTDQWEVEFRPISSPIFTPICDMELHDAEPTFIAVNLETTRACDLSLWGVDQHLVKQGATWAALVEYYPDKSAFYVFIFQ